MFAELTPEQEKLYNRHIRFAEIHLKNWNYEKASEFVSKAEEINVLGEEIILLKEEISANSPDIEVVEMFAPEPENEVSEVVEEPEMLFWLPKEEVVVYASILWIFILFGVLFFIKGGSSESQAKDDDPLSEI